MNNFFAVILAGLAFVVGTKSVLADTNLLGSDNYSFEDPVIATDPDAGGGQYVITSSIPDWTFSGAGSGNEATGIQTLASAFDNTGTADGLNYALLNIQQDGSGTITYTGTGADALPVIAADTDYTLTVAVGNRTDGFGGAALGGTDTLDLLAGTTAFGTTVNETQITGDTFTDETVTLSAATILADNLVGQSLGIQLIGSQYGSDGFDQAAFDNVRLTEATVAAPVIPTLYYDTNEITAGTATSSTQNFTDSVWTADPTGSLVTTGYIPSSDVVFSAGSNGTGTQAVTITDEELVHSFTFNNGAVTLLGSGAPNLHIEGGGITINSTVNGATTFDSTLGTITLDASQAWNNDSTQALNVDSTINGSGHTLTFDGNGSGATNLNGVVSGGLNLSQDSTTSVLTLGNDNNNFTGSIIVDGGEVAGTNAALGNSDNTIHLNDGGTIQFNTTGTHNIVLGVGGGQIASGGDDYYSGTITGGSGLNIVGGDFIPVSTDATNNVGTINVEAGRLLAYGYGIFNNDNNVNVSSGAVLDFWNNGTLNNTITLADGSALENRFNSIVLNNVVLPSTGTVTLGSDDAGFGSMTINSAIDLSGALTINLNGSNGGTAVYLAGTISGSGPLTINGTGNDSSYLVPSGGTSFGTSIVTLNRATIGLIGGTLSNKFEIGTAGSFDVVGGSGDETLNGEVELSQAQSNVSFANTSSSNFTVGNVTFDQVVNSDQRAYLDAYGSGSITFDGTYISPTLSNGQSNTNGGYGASTFVLGYFSQNGAANYYITPSADFSHFEPFDVDGYGAIEVFSGNLYLENSSFVPGQYIAFSTWQNTPNESLNIVGAQTINAGLYLDIQTNVPDSNVNGGTIQTPDGPWSLNQTTADLSTLNGSIGGASSGINISVVDGGRLNINGDVGGYISNSITTPQGTFTEPGAGTLVKTGAGTVVFADPNGNGYQTPNGVVADVQQGTLLVNNVAGQGYGLGTSAGVIKIEKGATLGGNASLSSNQTVVSEDAGSIIAPGDAGQASLGIAPSIGTLNLGNLSIASNSDPTTNGVTMDFKLTPGLNGMVDGSPAPKPGQDNDYLTAAYITLSGTVTINITDMGGITVGTPYILLYASSGLVGDPVDPTDPNYFTLNINTPAGYALDPDYGFFRGTEGYVFDTTGGTLTVQLIAVPEPSTYALLGLGLLGLVALGRFRSGRIHVSRA
jgi:hypothetical protein